MSLQDVINALRHEEKQLETQLSKIRAAIGALGSNIGYVVTGRGGPRRGRPDQPKPAGIRKRRRRLSAKARAAISAAQKKRWAKVRAAKKSV